MSLPSTVTRPASARVAFMIRRISVDLPAPFSPTRPMMHPAGREKLTSLRENCV